MLSYLSTTPTLRMATVQTIRCPPCPSCSGSIYLSYGRSITSKLNVTLSGMNTILRAQILALKDLANAGWTKLDVQISNSYNQICRNGGTTNTTITFYSDYGNIPPLILVANHVSSSSGIKTV